MVHHCLEDYVKCANLTSIASAFVHRPFIKHALSMQNISNECLGILCKSWKHPYFLDTRFNYVRKSDWAKFDSPYFILSATNCTGFKGTLMQSQAKVLWLEQFTNWLIETVKTCQINWSSDFHSSEVALNYGCSLKWRGHLLGHQVHGLLPCAGQPGQDVQILPLHRLHLLLLLGFQGG